MEIQLHSATAKSISTFFTQENFHFQNCMLAYPPKPEHTYLKTINGLTPVLKHFTWFLFDSTKKPHICHQHRHLDSHQQDALWGCPGTLRIRKCKLWRCHLWQQLDLWSMLLVLL